ncbi:Conserved hypothetical protein [gamma proteobacterium HdN1]|nr:Conserved hypothetical protein [gamma proteobacterium HdN1]
MSPSSPNDTHDTQIASSASLTRRRKISIAVDILMLILVIANLSLIVFDWLYATRIVQQILVAWLPNFNDWYRGAIRANFTDIDLIFVSIYLFEFSVQWAVASARKTYERWYYFPFIRWYDLLGCIPVGSFRWLRILRVISILVRLQQLGWVDFRTTRIGQFVIKYYRVLIEEISDRVVVNVLEGVQKEIAMQSKLLDNIKDTLTQEYRAPLLSLATQQIAGSVQAAHRDLRTPLEQYLARLTDEVLSQSRGGRQLQHLPFAGNLVRQQVQQLGLALVDSVVNDISAPENQAKLQQVLEAFLQSQNDAPLMPLIKEVVFDIIEQIKAQVAIQQWKLEEPADP